MKMINLSICLIPVPEYDVVPVSVVHSRKRRQDGLYISTERFGQHIKAWLNPMDGILAGEKTPVHFLGENPQNRYYPKVVTIGNVSFYIKFESVNNRKVNSYVFFI